MPGVAVPAMQQKESALDTVMKGLAIARDIYGIKSSMDKNDEAKADKAKKDAADEDARNGILDTKSYMATTMGLNQVAPGTEGAYIVKRRVGDKIEEGSFIKPPKEAARVDTTAADRLAFDKDRFAYQKNQDAKNASAKAAALPPPGQAPARKLNAEERKRLDSASMGLAAIKGMGTALGKGTNTFSIIGDNPYTLARTKFEEALGRMQSGGAINSDEEKRFKQMAPGPMDSPEIQKQKLDELYTEMALRIKGLGADPDELMANRQSIQVPGFGGNTEGTATAAPTTVKPEDVDSMSDSEVEAMLAKIKGPKK